jgi:DNA-binding CsgD family transcriptional regulator
MELQRALDLDSFWRANLKLLQAVLPHHSCSLLLGIIDLQPRQARHFVAQGGDDDHNRPLTSLSIARPYLESHPRVEMYTYSDILREDPQARQRRRERERFFSGWDEFVHLAFWRGNHPEAVLSVRRSGAQGGFTPEEREFLASLHPVIDAGLRRLRVFEEERALRMGMETFITGLPMPVMFLGPGAKLVFATEEAYELCAAWNFGFKQARSTNPRRCFELPALIAEACLQMESECERVAAAGTKVGFDRVQVRHPKLGGLTAQIDVSQPYRGPLVRAGFWVIFSADHTIDGAERQLRPEAVQQLQVLSAMERRVALLVAEGLRNRDVALKLGKSVRTVDFQLNAIYRKIGVRGRVELARLIY